MGTENVYAEPRQVTIVDHVFAKLAECELDFVVGSLLGCCEALEAPVIGLISSEIEQLEKKLPLSEGKQNRNQVKDEPSRKRAKLPLKHNDKEFDVAAGLVYLRHLRFVGDTKQSLQELVNLAHGNSEKVSAAILDSARVSSLLAEDGVSLKEEYRDVLLSALAN